jgi:hypothetical protein
MAKLRETPIGVADLEEYLRDHDDFALELDLFQHALQLNASAEHGGTYVDQVTGRHRQFDLRVRVEAPGHLVFLAIECKNIGKNYPLLVSRIPRERTEAFHQVLHSYSHRAPGEGTGMPRDRAEVLLVSDQGGLYPAGRPVGKSTAQVGRTSQGELTSGDSESYEKWSQALSSAHDLVARALVGCELTGSPSCLSVVLPVLVVGDETLWTVDYNAAGSPTGPPVQAEETELFIDRSYSVGHRTVYNISHLHIYTRSRFRDFLSNLVNTDTLLKKAFPHGLVPQ